MRRNVVTTFHIEERPKARPEVEIKVTYRTLAKFLTSTMQLEGEAYREAVEAHLGAIKALPQEQKDMLTAAYIFSRKVPDQEREDVFQELTLALLEIKPDSPRLAYAVARCDWKNWWEKYRRSRLFCDRSLNEKLTDEQGNVAEMGELLAGEVEWEIKKNGELDARALWEKIPDTIKPIVLKRQARRPLTDAERQRFSRFMRSQPLILAS